MENNERNETTYRAVFLGCVIKEKKDDPTKKYGLISLYYKGVRQDTNENWYTVQDQVMSVEKMQELTKDIPFGSNVELVFLTGITPGGKQRLDKMTIVQE